MKIPKPMLISDMSTDMLEGMLKNTNYGMERKRDGNRVLIKIDRKGELTAVSRSLKPYRLPTQIIEALRKMKKPRNPDSNLRGKEIILDGEVVWLCEENKDHRTKPQAGKNGWPVYAVWDLLIEGADKDPYIARKRNLIELVKMNGFTTRDAHIEYQPTYVLEDSKRRLLSDGELHGWEGYVFKELLAPYKSGAGAWAYRWKYEVTCDYVVIGYTCSEKPQNPFRALVLAAYDPKGTLIRKGQCGGGYPAKSDDTEKPTRSEIWETYLKDREYWMTLKEDKIKYSKRKKKIPHSLTDKDYGGGKKYGTIRWLHKKDWFVVEVKSQKFTEYNIPYMPQFIRIREDKQPKDCLTDR